MRDDTGIKVIRDEHSRRIRMREVVVGDIILPEGSDPVPASSVDLAGTQMEPWGAYIFEQRVRSIHYYPVPEEVIEMDELISAVTSTFKDYGEGKVSCPRRFT